MSQPKITFYVDIVSPFAYIAFHVLKVSSSGWWYRLKHV
jgi:2-hydroxychromene-2-carboxylate isomerase